MQYPGRCPGLGASALSGRLGMTEVLDFLAPAFLLHLFLFLLDSEEVAPAVEILFHD